MTVASLVYASARVPLSESSLELLEETGVVLREQTQVADSVFEVCDTLYTHAEGIAGVLCAVYAACLEHVGVNHAASENLNPPGMLAEATPTASTNMARYVHLGTGFGKREIAWAQTYSGIFAEHFAGEGE